MKHNQVTIKDIAEIAGVSFSTVSRCLNDSPLVSDATKQKVAQIAQEMGFEFNASARGLITSQVGTVAIVLPEQYTRISVNVYHGMLMNSLRTSLEKLDVDLIVTYHKNHYTGGNNITRLVTRRKIDGLIILMEDMDDQTLEFLKSRSIPFVFSHYPPTDSIKDQDVIYTDHYAGGKMVAEYLLLRGHRAFSLLAVDEPHLEFKLREEGFTDAIEKAGGTVHRYLCGFDFLPAKDLVTGELPGILQTSALFCMNDLMALGAMRALQDAGVSIPGEIAVVGYDDSEFGRYARPQLTTVHQPKEELAVLSCDRLFYQMEKQRTDREIKKKLISIQPVLVEREST
jgi:LacI family transcriptional regulator